MSHRDTPVVDAWMQHPTPAFLQQPFLESLWRWMGIDDPPEEIPLEFTAQRFEKAGVDRALVCAWRGPEGPLVTNEEVASFVEAWPELFVGVGSVDLHRPMEAVEQARYCVEELGFAAIRVVPWLWDLPPDDRRYYPLFAELSQLDVPVCTQVGHTGPLCPSEPGRPIPYLDHVALEFPDLTIVAGHIGHPWTEEMIALATKYENVYIDTSAYKPKRYPDELLEFVNGHGTDKVLFGTNYPMLQPDEALDGLEGLDLEPDVREAFLHGNAARVFGLDV